MALTIPTSLRTLIHSEYLHKRQMWAHPEMKTKRHRTGIQKSFEELLYGYLGKDAWRSTHISPAAVVAIVEGWDSRGSLVQRAHGILPGRMDRNIRTASLLEGPELSLDEWWSKFVAGDASILVTREEHIAEVEPEGLIPVPEGLFFSSGYSARMALKDEGVWLSAQYEALTGRPSPIRHRLPRSARGR